MTSLKETNELLRRQISTLDWKVKMMQKAVDFFREENARMLNGEPVRKKQIRFIWHMPCTPAVRECYITEGGEKKLKSGDAGPVYFWLTDMTHMYGKVRKLEVIDITDTEDHPDSIDVILSKKQPLY